MIVIGSNISSLKAGYKLAEKKNNLYLTAGLHPAKSSEYEKDEKYF